MNTRIGGLLAAVILLAAAPTLAATGSWQLDFAAGVTGGGRDARLLVLWVCGAVGVIVFGAMIHAIARAGARSQPRPARAHEPVVEVAWTMLVAVIMMGMALPAVQELARYEERNGTPGVRLASPPDAAEQDREGSAAERVELVHHLN